MVRLHSNPASDGGFLWIGSWGDRNCSMRATVRLGIDTFIANILVYLTFTLSIVFVVIHTGSY